MSDTSPTFHINIDDYIAALGIQAFADAFIQAMQRIVDDEKEVTVNQLLTAFVGNLQDDATDYWIAPSDKTKAIKADFNGRKLTYDEYIDKYAAPISMHIEFYDWDEKKLMEPDLLYYVKLTVESFKYEFREKLLAQINLLG
jgi:hypothetical protein